MGRFAATNGGGGEEASRLGAERRLFDQGIYVLTMATITCTSKHVL